MSTGHGLEHPNAIYAADNLFEQYASPVAQTGKLEFALPENLAREEPTQRVTVAARQNIETSKKGLAAFDAVSQRWPVHQRVAVSAVPGGVSATAVAEAGGVADEDLVGAEGVAVGASRRWVADC